MIPTQSGVVIDEDQLVGIEGPVHIPKPTIPTRHVVQKLPITGEHYWVQSIAIGATDIRAPSSGMKLRLTYVHVSAKGTVYAYLQFANHTGAPFRICPAYMAANTVMNANLTDTNIEGEADEKLQIVTDSANQLDVMVIVEEVPAKVVGQHQEE